MLAAGEKSIRKHYVLKVSKKRMFWKRNSFGDSRNASGHHGADRGIGGMSGEVWGLLGMHLCALCDIVRVGFYNKRTKSDSQHQPYILFLLTHTEPGVGHTL